MVGVGELARRVGAHLRRRVGVGRHQLRVGLVGLLVGVAVLVAVLLRVAVVVVAAAARLLLLLLVAAAAVVLVAVLGVAVLGVAVLVRVRLLRLRNFGAHLRQVVLEEGELGLVQQVRVLVDAGDEGLEDAERGRADVGHVRVRDDDDD